MISVPLRVISGRVFFRRTPSSLSASVERVLPFFGSGSGMRKTTSWTLPSRGWITKPMLVTLLRLRPCPSCLRQQFRLAVLVGLKQNTVLPQICVEPGALRGHERVAVDSEGYPPPSAKRSSCQTMPSSPFVFAEPGVSGEEARLFECLRNLPPDGALALFRLQLLPDEAWSSREADAMVRILLVPSACRPRRSDRGWRGGRSPAAAACGSGGQERRARRRWPLRSSSRRRGSRSSARGRPWPYAPGPHFR